MGLSTPSGRRLPVVRAVRARYAGAGITLSTILVCELQKRWSKSSFYFQTIPAKTTPAACWSGSAA